MRSDKSKALRLRLKGKSYNEISKLACVPKSTLSGWFTGLQLSEVAQQRLSARMHEASTRGLVQRNINQTKLAEQKAKNIRIAAVREISQLSKRELMLAGAILYWAEGYKRPVSVQGKIKTYHPVSLSNSDPALVKIFVDFLRNICEAPEEKIYAELRIYEHQNENYLTEFWSRIINIPSNKIRRFKNGPSISSQHRRPYNILPYGTIQVRVNSTELYHKIMGWIEGLSKI